MDLRTIKENFKDLIKYIIIIVVVLLVAIYVIGLQQVVGPSMSPNYNNSDILILDKISYRFTDIKRKDIVSLYYADTKYLIKRVIGLPGEYIEYKNNNLLPFPYTLTKQLFKSTSVTDKEHNSETRRPVPNSNSTIAICLNISKYL